jgi:hypothetical protein
MERIMSGSGGGGGGGEFPRNDIACELLQFETQISSPNPTVTGMLKVGDVLDVILRPGPTETIVLVFAGNDAGGILSPKASRLRECIHAGTIYKATVIAIRSPSIVSVRIAPIV